MHHVDRDTPWEEVWQAMDLLITQGKVIYVGSSNFAAWHIVAANEAARQRNTFGLVSEQSLYNLNTGAIELEVIPAVRPTESGSCLGALWGEDSSPDRSLRPRRVGGQRTV
jgi:aryl-alcohol dehydrogenase-like predicted oxidoreductase